MSNKLNKTLNPGNLIRYFHVFHNYTNQYSGKTEVCYSVHPQGELSQNDSNYQLLEIMLLINE